MNSWTAAQEATLRRMWADGASASQIAAALGVGVTRNAVIGKVHRLGINRETRAAVLARTKRPEPITILGQPKFRSNSFRQPAPPEPAPQVAAPPPEPTSRVPLLELRDGMCRWPLGAPLARAHLFCAEPVERRDPPVSYCSEHCRLAYAPRERRRVA